MTVFSFGVVVWEVLTVEDPFPEDNIIDLAVEIVRNGKRLNIPEATPTDLRDLMKGDRRGMIIMMMCCRLLEDGAHGETHIR